MTGFAASPGTDVDPACSSRRTRSPSADLIRAASRSNRAGQAGSYSTSWTGPSNGVSAPIVYLRISASVVCFGPLGRASSGMPRSSGSGLTS